MPAAAAKIQLRGHHSFVAAKACFRQALRDLRRHRWTLYDLQYLLCASILIFCFFVIEKPLWFKLPILLVSSLLLIPRPTRAFLLPFAPIAAYLVLFYTCRFIPASWRPHIFTSVLPALENILYGGNVSELLAAETSPTKDILAWIPYGVGHFVLPFVTAFNVYWFAPKGTLPVYARTFGYMSIAGVMTQLVFPCAPPWYEKNYGALEPATYSMNGDPGGLARVDDILGTNMYKSTFTASPLVFGAFPSLHSADAWLLALFTVFTFGPLAIPFVVTYVLWIWWSTMYLGHHYVVDLVGGAGYAVVAFWIGSFFLPALFPNDDDDLEGIYHEKQTLFEDVGDDLDDFVGYNFTKKAHGWEQPAHDDDDDDKDDELAREDVNSNNTEEVHEPTSENEALFFLRSEVTTADVVVEVPDDTASLTSTVVAPISSPAMQEKSHNNKRQSWNGWQGYEAWGPVLASVNSPNVTPRHSPANSPRTSSARPLSFAFPTRSGSTGSNHSSIHRHSRRDSVQSTGSSSSSVTTLNLDVEANAVLVAAAASSSSSTSAGSSSSKRDSVILMLSKATLDTIEEQAGSSLSRAKTTKAGGRSGRRPNRLDLDLSDNGEGCSSSSPSPSFSQFSSPSDDTCVDTDVDSHSNSSSSRPNSPRSFVASMSGSLTTSSAAYSKRFKDD
ncbi:Aureobasidin resistance protein Aur1 [Actinomortierella ambigua]|nr:Aureobasidin resistance protein Aur1 [Actinomortierella ambigua]